MLGRTRCLLSQSSMLQISGQVFAHFDSNRRRLRTMRTGHALRSVSVLTIAFGGLICHRWPCMLLNVRWTLFSNPALSARFSLPVICSFSVRKKFQVSWFPPFVPREGWGTRCSGAFNQLIVRRYGTLEGFCRTGIATIPRFDESHILLLDNRSRHTGTAALGGFSRSRRG